ncbi:MAG: glycosyltransferase family 2 protein [Polyangiaceae bacterium]|nr:glycosyltransferase family 2 protein [Polyangiaceae bacterium]
MIIPCLNEGRTLLQVVQATCERVSNLKEVIIVDDGSSDGGPQSVAARTYPVPVAIVSCGRSPRGKGWAVRIGLERARGAFVVVQDADLEYSASDVDALVKPLVEGHADAVVGSRFEKGFHSGYVLHRLGNWLVTTLANLLHGTAWTDVCAGYKALRRDVALALDLREDGFGIDAEMVGRLAQGPYRVLEAPISYEPRTFNDGKKLRFWHGLTVLRALVRVRWSRYWFGADRAGRPTAERTTENDGRHTSFEHLDPPRTVDSLASSGFRRLCPGRALSGARRELRVA